MNIPTGCLRIIGDVHGEAGAFAHALATDHFVIQLGDLVDNGPNSAGALRLALDLRKSGRGVFLLGNHDFKLLRALMGRKVAIGQELARTLAGLDEDLRADAIEAIRTAPAWLRAGDNFFVHGGFHPAMLHQSPPVSVPLGHTEGLLGRALFGQSTGRTQTNGFPERVLDWVEDIPAGLTVYVGHDVRSKDGRPWIKDAASGGRAVFLDTGAGKGGHLSWLDLHP